MSYEATPLPNFAPRRDTSMTTWDGFVPPVGNQVAAESATVAAAKTLQAQQGVQLTTFTWVQSTDGTGVAQFRVDFDVAFTAEPVVGHGIVMVGATPAAADADAAATARLAVTAAQEKVNTTPIASTDRAAALAAVDAAQKSLAATLALGNSPGAFPLSNVLVKQWLLNEQGHYVGAICIAVIVIPCSCEKAAATPTPDPPPAEEPAS